MRNIIVVGGGGHAKVAISVLRKIADLSVIGYTDEVNRGVLLDVPYLGQDSVLSTLEAARGAGGVIGVGQVGIGNVRERIWEKISSDLCDFPVIISPRAVVNEEVTLAEASIVMDGAVVNCGAAVGRGAIINTNSTVEHEVLVGSWVHISPGATVSGDAKIGDRTMIGAAAVVIQGVTICPDCVIGAGSTVIHNLTEPGVYVGCPARRIR